MYVLIYRISLFLDLTLDTADTTKLSILPALLTLSSSANTIDKQHCQQCRERKNFNEATSYRRYLAYSTNNFWYDECDWLLNAEKLINWDYTRYLMLHNNQPSLNSMLSMFPRYVLRVWKTKVELNARQTMQINTERRDSLFTNIEGITLRKRTRLRFRDRKLITNVYVRSSEPWNGKKMYTKRGTTLAYV